MLGHGDDVVHHRGDIREYLVVLSLQDVVGSVSGGLHDEGIVDEAFAKGLDLGHGTLDGEM